MDCNFQLKTYRCEWVAEVFTCGQYWERGKDSEVWYESVWPTREQALEALYSVTEKKGDNPNRDGRIYPGAKHSYYDMGVRYREVEVV